MLAMLRGYSTLGSTENTASSIAAIRSGRLRASSHPSRPRPRFAPVATIASASLNRISPLGHLLHRDRKHDDAAEEDRLDARIDFQQVHCVGEDQEEEGGERNHFDPADSAFQADAGDDRRGNALKRQLRINDGLPRS